MIIAFIFFILIFYTVVALGHLAVFFVIKTVLTLSPTVNIVGWLLSLLMPLFLIGVTVLSRYIDGVLFRPVYAAFYLWHGALVNFLIISALAFMLFLINKYTPANLNLQIAYAILTGIAVLISFAGIFNAINPKVKEIQVAIKNLPDKWHNQTVMQISDVHLGNFYQHNFLQKVINEINTIDPKILFITGDLFDGSYPDDYRLLEEFKNLNKNIQIFFVNGNHEYYHKGKFRLPEYTDAPAKNLVNEIADYQGLKIIGLDYSKPNIELLKELKPSNASILLYHEPKFIKQAKEADIKLQLAGHTHHGQQWPFNYITRMIYGKYHTGLNTEGDYNIYTTTGTGTWGPPMRTCSRSEIVKINLVKK